MSNNSPKITFILASLRSGSGGALSVTNMINELVMRGVDVKLLVLQRSIDDNYLENFLISPIFININEKNYIEKVPYADVYVATLWTTPPIVKNIADKKKSQTAYFIQDYEILFFPKEDEYMRNKVRETYKLIENKFAKTQWLVEQMKKEGFNCHKINPGMNLNIFYPLPKKKKKNITILAMSRPSTPRRSTNDLIKSLKIVKNKYPKVIINLFGEDPKADLDYNFVGKISHSELVKHYRNSDIYIDASYSHGFGRPGVEALACGCSLVTTDSGGIREYAKHKHNSMIAEVGSPQDIAEKVCNLIEDPSLRSKLIKNGIETVKNYSEEIPAKQFMDWVEKEILKK